MSQENKKKADPVETFATFIIGIFYFLWTSLRWTYFNCLKGVCSGQTPLSYALAPFILVYRSVVTYCTPCLGVYFGRVWDVLVIHVISPCCVFLGCVDQHGEEFERKKILGEMTDNDFKSNEDWHESIRLVPAEELDVCKANGYRMYLFQGKVEPADVNQGDLSDCWLLAAIACLAEHEPALRNVFLNKEYCKRGYYCVRLWNAAKKKFEKIQVNTNVPVSKQELDEGIKDTLYLKPNKNELWAILLEKAFAQFYGGYGQLSGGYCAHAWNILTGGNCFSFEYDTEKRIWNSEAWIYGPRCELYPHYDSKEDVPAFYRLGKSDVYFDNKSDESTPNKSDDEIFDILRAYCKSKCLMSAGIVGKKADAMKTDFGLVTEHAYSILRMARPGIKGMDKVFDSGKSGYKLIKLRNPWGNATEWKGAWSDGSKEWDKHPDFAAELDYVDEDDGTFWMDWRDFKEKFSRIQICDRNTKNDICLDVNETMPRIGPMVGCMTGCSKFWCLCQGCRSIYFGKTSNEELKTGQGCVKVCTAV